jgi:predicted TIM-barrel fold metal-dependent hydrolase
MTAVFDRRSFFVGSFALGAGLALPLRGHGEQRAACAPQSPQSYFGIDTHCHIFNAHDLPVAGFASRFLKGWEVGIPDRAVDLVFPLLERLERRMRGAAPTATDELTGDIRSKSLAPVEAKLPPLPSTDELLSTAAASARRKEKKLLGSPSLLKEFPASLGDELTVAAYLNMQVDDPQVKAWLREQDADSSLPPPSTKQLIPLKNASTTEWLISKVRKLFRFIAEGIDSVFKFLLGLVRHRSENATVLASLSPQVSLFTPALVDFDEFAEGQRASAGSTIKEQVELMGKLSRDAAAGRLGARAFYMHGFVPFNPRKNNGLELVKNAVSRHGFVGVKIYLNSGFKPSENKDEKWNRRLDELYHFCRTEAVPVLVHTGRFNAFGKHMQDFSHPNNWRSVLERFDGDAPLKLCLGHAALDEDETWLAAAIELCNQQKYKAEIFFDVSNNDHLDINKEDEERRLKRLNSLHQAVPDLNRRLLYGTDWFMNELNEEPSTGYWSRVHDQLCEELKDKDLPARLAENAVRYLGLNPGGKNRQRLAGFYGAGVPGSGHVPAWLDDGGH